MSRWIVIAGLSALLFACGTDHETVLISDDVAPDSTDVANGPDLHVVDQHVEPGDAWDAWVEDQFPPVDVDLLSDVDAGPLPGELGWPCESPADCLSGFCIETGTGKACTANCLEECPNGWDCRQLDGATDVVFICVPGGLDLCRPCQTNDHCRPNGVLSSNACVDYGPDGFFCGRDCSDENACPEGYECVESMDVTGATTDQCVLLDGLCECTPRFADAVATTTCYRENGLGYCTGERKCKADGLTDCDAPFPAVEICNGDDDNCNGEVDEDTSGGECLITNEFGICPGVVECIGGKGGCKGKEAAPETCDGLDNDCDGDVDENFQDTDNDGIADCLEDDKDGDGTPDGLDNCPGLPNPKQDDNDLDTVGDACDPDDDNDLVADGDDCAPLNPAILPGADEVCDGLDNDCNLLVDEGFKDTDADGWKDCIDNDDDDDGTSDEADCKPLDALAHPGAVEICDGMDNDCDNDVDEGFADADDDGLADCVDDDQDGDGVADENDNCPKIPNEEQTDADGDTVGDPCDPDRDGDSIPNAVDNCPDLKNVAQGDVDEDGTGDLCDDDIDGDDVANDDDNCPLVANPDQLDQNQDGTGDACAADKDGDGVDNGLDCAPGDPAIYPGAEETCDGLDNDCDATIDEGFIDTDQDGLKNCVDGDDDNDGDGDDADCAPLDPKLSSSAMEVCDGIDNDCDGKIDESLGELSCGKGQCAHTSPACLDGQVQQCDPLAGAEVEFCDGLDNDCDGLTDEDLGQMACGLGPCAKTVAACVGGAPNECDPLAEAEEEVCDGLDNDCDGKTDEDQPVLACGKGQCYHTTPSCIGGVTVECNAFQGALPESCDGLDNDCDGEVDEELGTTTCGLGACEHTVDNCANGAPQICNPFDGVVAESCDGVDNDCNGLIDEIFDKDGDGQTTCGGDCNDWDVNNWDSCDTCGDADGDGYYGNCNQYITLTGPDCNDELYNAYASCDTCLDNDGDGRYVGCDQYADATGPDCNDDDVNNWDSCDACIDGDEDEAFINCDAYTTIVGPDCDDTDPTTYPEAALGCDGLDHDCDGAVDNDLDEDGFTDAACGGTDCVDSDASIKPDPAGGCALGTACKAIVEGGLSSGDGIYWVDVDGYDTGAAPFQVYCDMSTDNGGWTLVYKLSKDVDYDIVGLWQGGSTLNEDNTDYLDLTKDGAHYRNRFVDLSWSSEAVLAGESRVVLYTAGDAVRTITFSLESTDKNNWYTQGKVTASDWTDLTTQGKNYFTIPGDAGNGRHWFISRNYGGCPADSGWLVVDRGPHPCSWETKRDPAISIIYSKTSAYLNWNDANIAEADVFAVFVR